MKRLRTILAGMPRRRFLRYSSELDRKYFHKVNELFDGVVDGQLSVLTIMRIADEIESEELEALEKERRSRALKQEQTAETDFFPAEIISGKLGLAAKAICSALSIVVFMVVIQIIHGH